MNHKYIKNLSVFLALVLMLGSVFAALPNMARAEEGYAGSELLITEICYNSGNEAPFIEIYNATDEPINLAEYKIWRSTNRGSKEIGTNFDENSIIQPRSTVITVLKNIGIEAFNQKYNSNVSGDSYFKVATETWGGKGFVAIANVGTTIDKNNYQTDSVCFADYVNMEQDKSIHYSYPTEGNGMIQFGEINAIPNPGEVSEDQVPPTGDIPTDPVPVTGITISGSNEVSVGNTTKLDIAYTPENTTEKGVTWTSSDETVATVDENGVVKGIAEGTATITATSTKNINIKATHEITVKAVDIMKISEARTFADGENVLIQGIVTFIDSNNNYYIQDETAGIDLFKSKQDLGLAVEDIATVSGKLSTYNGLREIVPDKVIKVSSGNPLPEPKVVTIPEVNNYQSQRVKIEKVTLGTINTGGDTEITDLQGNKINIYKVPELTNVKEGDLVDVVAVASIFKTPQLRVRVAEDITKAELGEDTNAPVIEHTPVTEGNVGLNLEIKAKVTDDREVKGVKLYYRTKGEAEYKSKDMTLNGEEYIAVVPKEELNVSGLQYYILATDGTNEATSPEDINNPYEVEIKDKDIIPPTITNVVPADEAVLDKADTKPTIKAEYNDPSGIDTEKVQMLLDGVDVTKNATVTESSIEYIPTEDLKQGTHLVTVYVEDNSANKAGFTWTFTIGESEYNFYFGQIHSHTKQSDGTGTLDDAFTWAKNNGNADFFAVTDHSNSMDHDLDNENIADVSESTSDKWKLVHEKANHYNKDNEYIALAGYEMTWSGSTGGWGHMNTFNTPWFASRNNSKMDLQAYYNKISQYPDSINQFNHPGKTFGDFANFGYYSPAVDRVVQLIEVGNGEGDIRGSGYFPSYEYYTRALDKGWHLAPTNNQDNHKGNWVTSNEGRTVILSPELTRDSLFDSIRAMRVYATEDSNLKVMYKVNGKVMGSRLQGPDKLNISINITDPDETDAISKVELISNGGVVSASKTFNTNVVNWEFELDPTYSYYYVRVTQADKDIAVTAPVWTSEVTPVGLSGLEVSSDYFELGDTIQLDATVYNNGENILSSAKVEFYAGSVLPENKIGEKTIADIGKGNTAIATIDWKPERIGEYNLYAVAKIMIDGVEKSFTANTKVEVVPQGSATKVMVDYAHSNHYVSGSYAGKIEGFKGMLKDKKMIMVENHSPITDETLKDVDILVITSPQPTDDTKYNIVKSKLSGDEIQAVKRFTEGGGSLILTSRANYKDGTGEYQNAYQGNEILNSIGSNLVFNSDEVIDEVKNEGQTFRLKFDNYTSTKYNLTDNIDEGLLYSFYSGCSVLLKDGGNSDNVDFLVKGHPTTKNFDASNSSPGYVPLEEGNVYVLAAEELPSGGKVIVSGTTFFSDFEVSAEAMHSNNQITLNILDWLKPQVEYDLSTIKEVRDGMPENFGETFMIEGRVASESVAYTKNNGRNNAFFDVIYVQDETGGITVFGVSQKELPLGTKVRIIGTAGQYEGDYQLQIKNELTDLAVLDDPVEEISPKEMSTGDSMKKENEGWLVKIQGTVKRIDLEKNSIYLDDGTGEARVYVNGYIGDGTGDESKVGKWDSSIKVGDTVSAIGLASTDPEGPRLRVRNTGEIIKAGDRKYPLFIGKVEKVEESGELIIKIDVSNVSKNSMNSTVIIKLMDDNGRPYIINFKELKLSEGLNKVEFNLSPENYSSGIKWIKIYIWDSFDGMKPLADTKEM